MTFLAEELQTSGHDIRIEENALLPGDFQGAAGGGRVALIKVIEYIGIWYYSQPKGDPPCPGR